MVLFPLDLAADSNGAIIAEFDERVCRDIAKLLEAAEKAAKSSSERRGRQIPCRLLCPIDWVRSSIALEEVPPSSKGHPWQYSSCRWSSRTRVHVSLPTAEGEVCRS